MIAARVAIREAARDADDHRAARQMCLTANTAGVDLSYDDMRHLLRVVPEGWQPDAAD